MTPYVLEGRTNHIKVYFDDAVTRAVLEHFATNPPRTEDACHIPDFVIEVVKMGTHLSDCPYRSNKKLPALGVWSSGEKLDEGQDMRALVDWHDTTHDQASFDDLQTLTHLVVNL
ncbi:hypothetical protein F5887DRAFT_914949 [Amanita rubescens]|nr:hypothetical protein F5887DRAFT_914949 [Amanita rubescens]